MSAIPVKKKLTSHSVLKRFQGTDNEEIGTDYIFRDCANQLNLLFEFKTVSFMLIDENDQSFSLTHCEPTSDKAFVQSEIDHLIETGVFAWVISQTKPIFEKSQDEKQILVLNTLSTRARIRGMFIGVIDEYGRLSNVDIINLLSAILQSTSNLLENYELFQHIHEQNLTLEETINERTSELEKARAVAEAANEAKSNFLANISHEIRTPLTAIVGYADLLRYGLLSASEQDRAVTDILQAAKHLSGIINDILDLSKIEANKMELETISTSLFQVLDSIEAIAQGQAKEKGLSFKIDYQFPMPLTIKTDPTRLKQILLNLCNNAAKFTEDGEIKIQVSCLPEQEKMVFAVSDTGIGIRKEKQDKLFHKFVQADESTTRNYGGSGLGLAISKQLAEMLGGTITFNSKLNEGSCFTVSIGAGPINQDSLIYAMDELPEHDKKAGPWSVIDKFCGHVLLAEDNINNQQLISLFLTKANITVDVVDNGNDAIEKALVNHYDVILMDMQMPIMGGIEATEMLRSAGCATPIIALTANATAEIKKQCHAVGFNEFLSKPIEVDVFFDVINQFLKEADIEKERSNHLNDPEFQIILQQFIKELPDTIAKMVQFHQQKNWLELKSLAHQLKGVAGGYGYPEVGVIAGRIQSCLEENEFNDLSGLLDNLQSELIEK